MHSRLENFKTWLCYSLYKCWTKKQNYVKECFNDAQQSSETNLDAVIVQQNKSKLESATDLEKFFVKTQRKWDILQENKNHTLHCLNDDDLGV